MADNFDGKLPYVIPRAIRLKGGVNIETISGDVTMTLKSSTFQRLNGGAADRTLTLPAVATNETSGLVYEFYNSGSTNDLIIEDAGGTVKTLTPGSWARLASDGSDWYVMDSTSAGTTDLGDSTALNFGDANDITMQWDGTRFVVGQATANSEIRWGADGAGIDQVWYGDTASESITWDQSADDLILTAAVRVVGQGSTVMPLLPIAAQQALSGAGAVNITTYYTAWTTTGADAGTLADGAQVGQLKKIQLIVDGGDGTLTPTNLSGGTTITFADAGDYALLCWDGSNWVALELGNDADGASAPVLA